MINVTNHDFLRSRGRWAQILSIAGMAALVGGILLSSRSLLISWLLLLIGLIAASIGANFANLYVRAPRSEDVLDRALRGFDDRHVLYNFVLPIPHLFLTPTGPWILQAMKQRGEVRYDGKKWRQKFTLGRLFGVFSEPRLGKPAKDLQEDIDLLQEDLREAVEEDVTVRGALVFTDPDVRLDAANSPLPVIRIEDLKEWLRRQSKGQSAVPAQTRRRIQEILDEWTGQS